MSALIVGIPVVLAAAALAFAAWLGNRPEPAHGDPSRAQRAGKRIREATAAARAWWAARRALPAEDQETADVIHAVHENEAGRWWCVTCADYTPNGGECPVCGSQVCGSCGACADEADHPPTGYLPAPEDTPGAAVLDEAPAAAPEAPDVPAEPWPGAWGTLVRPSFGPPEDVPGRETGSALRPAPAPAGDTQPRTAGVEPGPEPGTPPAGVRDPVPAAARAWAIGELTGQHPVHADTGAFPKVTGVA